MGELPVAAGDTWEDAISVEEGPEDGGDISEIPDRTGEAALLPVGFGLKNPAKVFWPEVAVPEGTAEDLERLMGEIEGG